MTPTSPSLSGLALTRFTRFLRGSKQWGAPEAQQWNALIGALLFCAFIFLLSFSPFLYSTLKTFWSHQKHLSCSSVLILYAIWGKPRKMENFCYTSTLISCLPYILLKFCWEKQNTITVVASVIHSCNSKKVKNSFKLFL